MNSGHRVSLWHSRFFRDDFDDESVLIVLRHVSARNKFAVLRDIERARHYRAARFVRSVLVEICTGDIVMQGAVVADVQVRRGHLCHEVVYVRHRVHTGVIVVTLEDRRIVVFVQHDDRRVRVSVFWIARQWPAGLCGVDVEIGIVGRENGEDILVPRLAIERFIRVNAAVRLVHVKRVPFVP